MYTQCVCVCASSPVALNHPLLCLTAPSCSSQASGGKVGVKVKSAYQKRFGFHFVRLHVDRFIMYLHTVTIRSCRTATVEMRKQ